MTDYKEVRTTHNEAGQGQRTATFRITQLIWLFLGLLEGALGLRVIFKLFAVNPSNPFASFLYGVTDIFLAPFASLAGSPSADGMVLEISTVLAMIVYALAGWAFERIVYALLYSPRGAVSTRQTVVSDHVPQATVDETETTTTETVRH
ncbi:MAG TPA: YggT family protein [Anaerolineales bacterium]|nr:YggT family protein [Anaerolineales bacterium]